MHATPAIARRSWPRQVPLVQSSLHWSKDNAASLVGAAIVTDRRSDKLYQLSPPALVAPALHICTRRTKPRKRLKLQRQLNVVLHARDRGHAAEGVADQQTHTTMVLEVLQ